MFLLVFFALTMASNAQNAPQERRSKKPKTTQQSSRPPQTTVPNSPQTQKTCRVTGSLVAGAVKDAFSYCSSVMPNTCQVIKDELLSAEKTSSYLQRKTVDRCEFIVERTGNTISFVVSGTQTQMQEVHRFFSNARGMRVAKQGF